MPLDYVCPGCAYCDPAIALYEAEQADAFHAADIAAEREEYLKDLARLWPCTLA